MKLFLILFLVLVNCTTAPKKPEFLPSEQSGCSGITETKNRLACIGRLLRQLEGIRNAKIVVSTEDLDRIDMEYINSLETYCFTSPDETEKFLCFESKTVKYDPTTLGKIYSFGVKFGFGFLIGIVTGVAVSG